MRNSSFFIMIFQVRTSNLPPLELRLPSDQRIPNCSDSPCYISVNTALGDHQYPFPQQKCPSQKPSIDTSCPTNTPPFCIQYLLTLRQYEEQIISKIYVKTIRPIKDDGATFIRAVRVVRISSRYGSSRARG